MKTMKKTVAFLLIAVLMLSLAVGCAKREDDAKMRVGALKGPTGMGLAYMIHEPGEAYASIDLYDAPDAITGKFVSGELDIAAVPINLASALYNKTEGNVVMLAVDTLGVLYVLENGNSIATLSDLSGKTVYAIGQGSTPEYILNYLLAQNDVTDVSVEFVGENAALASMMAAGEAEIAMLPEPNVSAVMAKNADVRIALDLTQEWDKVSESMLVQGCYIASRTFYEAHPKLVEQFLSDCAMSVERVNNDADAADVIAGVGILPSAGIAKKAIGNSNIVCITGAEMKSMAAAMLQVLFDANPKSVGGKLPDDALYGN